MSNPIILVRNKKVLTLKCIMILTDFDKHTKFNDIRCLKIPFPVTKLIQKSYNCNFKSTGRCI